MTGMAPRPAVFRSILGREAGLILVAAIIAWTAIFDLWLLTPVEIGGTLFGGAFTFERNALGGAAAMAGILIAALLRLPGFRLAWAASGLLPLAIGANALWRYPDDAGGNLIFSPQPQEIAVAMVVAAGFLLLGIVLRRYLAGRTRPVRAAIRLPVMAAMGVVYLGIPAVTLLRHPAPPCAFDSVGRQVSACLGGPDEAHVTVD
jgi:hypothetical protein